MNLFLLEPEVAGGIGEKTTYLKETYPNGVKKISHLEYEFEGWLGDELLETTPCFIVSEELANSILNSDLNGYSFDKVEVNISDIFQEIHPNIELPKFKRLIPEGTIMVKDGKYNNWSEQDFNLSQNLELVVTETAFKILKSHRLNNCVVLELD